MAQITHTHTHLVQPCSYLCTVQATVKQCMCNQSFRRPGERKKIFLNRGPQVHKRYSTSPIIRAIQIKTMMISSHYHQNGYFQKDCGKVLAGYGEKGTYVYYWQEWELVQPLWETVRRFLKKLKIELPFDSAISLLLIDIYSKEIKSPSQRDIYTSMFITVLFTTART